MSTKGQRGHALLEAVEHAIDLARRRREERTRAAQIVADVRNRLAAPSESVVQAARETVGDRAALDRDRAVRLSALHSLKADLRKSALPGAASLSALARHLRPAPVDEMPLALPACLSTATRCEAPASEPAAGWLEGGRSLCSAAEALLRLYHGSEGLGGSLGVEAIPAIPPVSGSLFYAFVPPSNGYLSVAAEVSLTGTINAFTTLESVFGELPTIYADASLTLRVTLYQGASAQSTEMKVDSRHSAAYPGNLSVFANDLYVVPATVPLGTMDPVVVQVEAELYAFGRSDDGHAEIDFSNVTPGGQEAQILVPVLCLGLTPFPIVS